MAYAGLRFGNMNATIALQSWTDSAWAEVAIN